MQSQYERWIDDAPTVDTHQREAFWTESVAVGHESLVEAAQERMGLNARHSYAVETSGKTYALRELTVPYNHDFGVKTGRLSFKNTLFLG